VGRNPRRTATKKKKKKKEKKKKVAIWRGIRRDQWRAGIAAMPSTAGERKERGKARKDGGERDFALQEKALKQKSSPTASTSL